MIGVLYYLLIRHLVDKKEKPEKHLKRMMFRKETWDKVQTLGKRSRQHALQTDYASSPLDVNGVHISPGSR